jgi:hypothetical protein
MQDKLIEQKHYGDRHGQDLPAIRNWKWSDTQVAPMGSQDEAAGSEAPDSCRCLALPASCPVIATTKVGRDASSGSTLEDYGS